MGKVQGKKITHQIFRAQNSLDLIFEKAVAANFVKHHGLSLNTEGHWVLQTGQNKYHF
jgi:hypothetical protein